MDALRIGKISSINYANGTARVLYTDRDKAVTAELPLLSFEYRMPSVDDFVLVCHLPNGAAAGIIVGPFWTDTNRPPEGREGLYRKDFDKTAGICFMRYESGKLEFVAPTISFTSQKGETIDGLLERIETLERHAETHTHTDSLGGETSAPN